MSAILSRCRKLVGHFKHSYVAQSALESKQTEYELPKHKLIQDVPTRWNSAFEMMERILEQEKAIAAVLLNSRKARDRDLTLTSTEIKNSVHSYCAEAICACYFPSVNREDSNTFNHSANTYSIVRETFNLIRK